MKRIALVLAVIGAIGVGITLLRSPPVAPRLPISQGASLHFIGFTNINPKGKFVTFCISNETPVRFAYALSGVDWKTTDGWISASLGRRLGMTSRQWVGFGDDGQGGILGAGHSIFFHVPARMTNAPWRFHIRCQEYSTGVDGLTDRVRDVARNVKETNPAVGYSEGFKGRRYDLVSPEISE